MDELNPSGVVKGLSLPGKGDLLGPTTTLSSPGGLSTEVEESRGVRLLNSEEAEEDDVEEEEADEIEAIDEIDDDDPNLLVLSPLWCCC